MIKILFSTVRYLLLVFLVHGMMISTVAQKVFSPDKKIRTDFIVKNGQPFFSIRYDGKSIMEESPLGLERKDADFTKNLRLMSVSPLSEVSDIYQMKNAKRSRLSYHAVKRIFHLQNTALQKIDIIFQVSNDGVAFRYFFPDRSTEVKTVIAEATAYHFNSNAKAWLQPMSVAKSGWEKSNPAYEERYLQEIAVGAPSQAGWVYPALFKSNDTWLLISETGLDTSYCATRLVNDSASSTYKVGFPDAREIFTGRGLSPQSVLPWYSPWRFITIGSLKTIIESTLGTDLAKPAIKVDSSFIKPGKAAWSWINSKDDSIVYSEQKRYIDYASSMRWKYCLIDVNWDTKIGYEKIKELADYAGTKNVGLILWYNSAGDWNTTPYHPKSMLLTHEQREKEFERLQSMGIKGVKIDFFGGDGQSMIKYYLDILNDAAKYKLLVNFHGATLPRGWQRTYPHLITTEAVRGFEMVTFNQGDADNQATHCAMLPFTRNAFDPMDFTPMNLNKVYSRVQRRTTSAFELALSVLFLSGIQHYAESPAGMELMPTEVINFLREVPEFWDDVKFIDGYPGKYIVVARRSGTKWYVCGINAEKAEKKLLLDLSFLKNRKGNFITDGESPGTFESKEINLPSAGQFTVDMKAQGGFVMVFN